jgi:hypothetical protein
MALLALQAAVVCVGKVPLPTARQLEFMELETIQVVLNLSIFGSCHPYISSTKFMHFSINTFWQPSDDFLRGPNPTVGGNCQVKVTGTSNDSQTSGGFWPCLNPRIFDPEDIDPDKWMEASASLGMKEICLTAKHFGGFALWPSNHTPVVIPSTLLNSQTCVLQHIVAFPVFGGSIALEGRPRRRVTSIC